MRQNQGVAIGTQALQAATNTGLPLTTPLENVGNSALGSFYVVVNVAIGTTATNVPINLPRRPSGCLTFSSTAGTLVYQTTGDYNASTGAVFVCRSNSATTATLFVG